MKENGQLVKKNNKENYDYFFSSTWEEFLGRTFWKSEIWEHFIIFFSIPIASEAYKNKQTNTQTSKQKSWLLIQFICKKKSIKC